MLLKRLGLSAALLLALGLGLAPSAAQATTIADTGTPSNGVGAGWAFNSAHSYAGQFSVLGDMTITSILGYFGTDAGSVGISLYSNVEDDDGGFIPGSALRTASIATSLGAATWNGASALDWAVGQGTYWVVFSSTWGTASQASMPGYAPNPLSAYALQQGGQWYDAADFGLGQGLRVEGAAAAPVVTVPEPAGVALFGLGLIAVGVVRRRKQA